MLCAAPNKLRNQQLPAASGTPRAALLDHCVRDMTSQEGQKPGPGLDEPARLYSPASNPFGERPTARTPQGIMGLRLLDSPGSDGEGWRLGTPGGAATDAGATVRPSGRRLCGDGCA